MRPPCSVADCTRRHYAQGHCELHLRRLRKHGSTDDPRLTVEERFWSRVDKSGNCWTWKTSLTSGGYGTISRNGKHCYAHRLSYEMANGSIPEDKMVDHRCHNRTCVRPDHLRLVNNKQNLENMSGPKITSKSRIRGVYLHESGKWRAQVTHNRKRYNGGSFTRIEDAEEAAIALRNKLFTHNTIDRAA